jgi:hypothetical protein
VSSADKALYVYRNGNPIGRAPLAVTGFGSIGNHVFSLLEGASDRESSLVPGRNALRWMNVTTSGRGPSSDQISKRLRINPEFAGKIYETVEPGTTVIITDQPVIRSRKNAAILES